MYRPAPVGAGGGGALVIVTYHPAPPSRTPGPCHLRPSRHPTQLWWGGTNGDGAWRGLVAIVE